MLLVGIVAMMAANPEGATQAAAAEGGIMKDITKFCLDSLEYWWVIVLFMAIESSFIPFPSEVVVPPAAWLACQPDSNMNVVMVVVLATIGADIGALVNYYLSSYLGRPVIYKFADSKVGHLCLLNGGEIGACGGVFPSPRCALDVLRPPRACRASVDFDSCRSVAHEHPQIPGLHFSRCGHLEHGVGGPGICHFQAEPGDGQQGEVVDLASAYSHEIGYGILAILGLLIVYFVGKKLFKKWINS